jgi:hypothetical protein
MKNLLYKFLILITTVSLLSSCLWDDDDETELSDNPNFVSLKFGQNDSIPGLENAVFTLEYDSLLADSIIVNLDSLPFQTRIDSVFPTFTFRSTYLAYLIMTDSLGTGLDSIALSGKDTVDFTRVKAVRNFAANNLVSKTYPIKVNVHQVEPEMYLWFKKTDQLYAHSGSVQQAVFFDNRFFFYVSSGVNNYLYTSADAVSWTGETVSGLPPYTNLRDIRTFNNKLYLVHEDGLIYHSTDGKNWTGTNPAVAGHTINNLLFVLENKLWGVFQQDVNKQYYFATTSDGAAWQINDAIPANFPIVDFASLAFKSRTNKPKAIMLGGLSADGTLLSKVWSVERNINNEYKWVDFTLNVASLDSLSGASLINYDNKLLLFGGMDANGDIVGNGYMESIDEGFSWRNTDTTYNVIRDVEKEIVYQPRSYQSVIHDETNHNIYLIGGRNKGRTGVNIFSDVWVGKLNRMTFIRK